MTLFLHGLFLLFPTFSLLVPLGTTIFMIVTALVAFFLLKRKGISLKRLPNRDTILLILTFIWIFLSCFWSLTPLISLKLALSLSLLQGAGLLLFLSLSSFSADHKNSLLKSLTIGFFCALLFLFIDIKTGGWFYSHLKNPDFNMQRYNQGVTILALLLGPVMAYLFEKKPFLIAPLIPFYGYLLQQLDCDAPILAFFISAPVVFLAFLFKKKFIMACAFLSFIFIIAAPLISLFLITQENLEKTIPTLSDDPYYHRIHMWQFISKKAIERPLTGWGLDTARHDSFNCDLQWTQPCKLKGRKDANGPSVSLHPHNASLQWWLELGGIGALLFALLIGSLGFHLAQSNVSLLSLASLTSSYVSALVISHISYGIWQNWWVASLWLTIAFSSLRIETTTQSRKMDCAPR